MRTIFFFIIILDAVYGCKISEPAIQTICDKIAIVSTDKLRDAPRDPFQVLSIEIVADCLEITVRYGGGVGGADFQFMVSEEVDDSNTLQRAAVISLNDEDHAEALITKTISFDLTPTRIKDSNEVLLNIEGHRALRSYQY